MDKTEAIAKATLALTILENIKNNYEDEIDQSAGVSIDHSVPIKTIDEAILRMKEFIRLVNCSGKNQRIQILMDMLFNSMKEKAQAKEKFRQFIGRINDEI